MEDIKINESNPPIAIVNRNRGKFIKGFSGNPAGKPKGSGISITTEIKKKLKECPEGSKATYLQLLLNRIFKSAIQDGDVAMIKDLINRVDGMPKQAIDHTSDGDKIESIYAIIKKAGVELSGEDPE